MPVSRRTVVVSSLLIGAPWAFSIVLALAKPDPFEPVTLLDYVAVATFSATLAVFAPAAWLIARLAARSRWVTLPAVLTAGTALVAAIGNIVEDGFGISEAGGRIFVYGLGGLLLGLIALAVVLAVRRELSLAGLTAVSLVGLFSSVNGGGIFVVLAWLGMAIWSINRRSLEVVDGDAAVDDEGGAVRPA